MIGPADVTRWAESLFDDYLRSLLTGEPFFPKRKGQIGRVSPGASLESFRREVAALWAVSKNQRGFGYTLILEEKTRRSRGLQNEPTGLLFETASDYLEFLGAEKDAHSFQEGATHILRELPEVRPALLANPRLVVTECDHWAGIISVVKYLCAHPRPGCYVRALPVPVPTKFIEEHTVAIETLLRELPASGFMPDLDTFAQRCGFREDQPLLRGRFLCPELQRACGFPSDDVALPVSAWTQVRLPEGARVLGCENKANFLALPPLARTLALWGGGGAAAGYFRQLTWLQDHRFVYWGDLDPCGLNILAQIRAAVPTVRSVLMDEAALRAQAQHLVAAKLPSGKVALAHLQSGETDALNILLHEQKGVEQERLLFSECMAAVEAALQ